MAIATPSTTTEFSSRIHFNARHRPGVVGFVAIQRSRPQLVAVGSRRAWVTFTKPWQDAEAAVARYLERHGFDVVATNLRVGHLEIDIVARLGPLIVVVEVRTRGETAWTRGLASVDWKKRERIRRAGQRLWQRRYRHDTSAQRMRFDVASVSFVSGQPHVEYVAAAF